MNIEQLNTDLAVTGQLEFVEGKGGLIQARIKNDLGEAVISTYAAQVLSYKPAGDGEDLLFVSEAAYYQEGKATKGGIPVCWPWFGPDPQDKGRGGHGFVRNRQWQVMGSNALEDGSTRLVLGLDSNYDTLAIWPHAFELRMEFIVGATLSIGLITLNEGSEPVDITQGLHSYFRVGDISQASVMGLEGSSYIDKMDESAEKTQDGPVRIAGEVDRIYTGVEGDLVVDDPVLGRRIRIASQGSRSAVVWNPWIDTTKAMGDLQDDDYQRMLCVETTNAGPDVVNIPAGGDYRLGARLSIERD